MIFAAKDKAIDAIGPANIGFRWIKINGILVYGVYCSPNVPVDEYNEFLSRLEDRVRRADGPVIVAGDFNDKLPKWGSPMSVARRDAL